MNKRLIKLTLAMVALIWAVILSDNWHRVAPLLPSPPEKCPRPDLSGPDDLIYDGGGAATVSRKDRDWRAYQRCLDGPSRPQNVNNNNVDTCEASKAEYLHLRDGMSYDDAVSIIGCEGEETSRSRFGDLITVRYSWRGNGMISSMDATFQDGGLTRKGQLGLR